MDFDKELKKFNFFEIDHELVYACDEPTLLLETYTQEVRRMNREQNKVNMAVGEIIEWLNEEKEKSRQDTDFKNMIEQIQETCRGLVSCLLNILDPVEDLYRYASKADCGNLGEQMRYIWKKIGDELLSKGITRVDDVYRAFSMQMHTIEAVRTEEEYPPGIVLEVLKSGYIYQSAVIRRAKVVVNTAGGSMASSEDVIADKEDVIADKEDAIADEEDSWGNNKCINENNYKGEYIDE